MVSLPFWARRSADAVRCPKRLIVAMLRLLRLKPDGARKDDALLSTVDVSANGSRCAAIFVSTANKT